MKKHPVLIAAALVAGFAIAPLQAQDNALMPMGNAPLLPSIPEGLIVAPPPTVAPTPSIAAPAEPAATPPVSPKKGSADELRQAIWIRELRTLVLEYPSVQAQKQGAECAKTNTGRNAWMRNYYTLIYTNMERLAPSLHDVLEDQLCGILERFEQHKVYPSPLIENVVELPGSHSADHVISGAKPTPASKHHPKKKSGKVGFGM